MPAGFVSFKDLGVDPAKDAGTSTPSPSGFVSLPQGATITPVQIDTGLDDEAAPKKKPGIGDTLSSFGKRAAIPTAAFVAGAQPGEAGGAALGALTGPLAPIAVPVGTVVGGLITGGAAAFGASKAQDAYLDAHPELAQKLGIDPETLAAQKAEHPVAAVVGQALPQLATFRPSLSTAKDLLGLAGAKAALKAGGKVATGAIIGGGVDATQQYAETGEIDPVEVAVQAAVGGTLTEPWLLHKPIAGVGRAATRMVPGGKAVLNAGDAAMGRDSGTLDAERPVVDPSEPVDLLKRNPIQDVADVRALPAPGPKPMEFPETLTNPREDERFSADAIRDHLTSAVTDAGGDASLSAKDIDNMAGRLSTAMQAGDTEAVVGQLTTAQKRIEARFKKLEDDRAAVAEDVRNGIIQPTEARKYNSDFQTTERVLTQAKSLLDPALDLAARYEQHKSTYDQHFVGEPPAPEDVLVTPPPQPEPAAARPPVTLRTVPNNGRPEYAHLPPTPPIKAADTLLAEGLKTEHESGLREAAIHATDPMSAVEQTRAAILDKVLNDGTTRNPTRRFTAELKRVGLEQHIASHEAERIGRFEDAKAAFTQPPQVVEASPDESGHFGIPERKAAETQVEAQSEPAAPVEHAPAPAPVDENIRTRAEAHADKLGSSRRAWFLRGVDHELGEHEQVAPTSKSKANWFDEGRQYVRDERAHQDRERGGGTSPADHPGEPVAHEPDAAAAPAAERPVERPSPEAMPKSRGGRGTFLREVDEAVGTKITARDAQMLKAAEDLREDIAGKETRTVSTAELWKMFDEAVGQHDRDGGLVKAEMSRRTMFKGGVAVAMPGVARAQEGRTQLRGNDRVREAIKSGSLQKTIEAIRDTSTNPLHRELARIMALGGVGDARIEVVPQSEDASRYGQTSSATGHVTIYQSPRLKDNGFTEETILHEALHSFLAKRYFSLSVYGLHENRAKLGQGEQHGDTFADKFVNEVWRPWSTMMEKKFPDLVDTTGTYTEDGVRLGVNKYSPEVWAQEAWRDPDELFVRSLTDPDLQKFLKSIDMQGNKIEPRDPNSWWNKLVDFFSKMLGIKREDTSAFAKIVEASNSVLKAGALDRPTGEFAGKVADKISKENYLSEKIKREPRKAEIETKVNLQDWGKKSWMWVMTTRDLAQAATKLLPSAGRFIEANSKSHSLARQFEDRLGDIKRTYEQLDPKLKGNGKGSVNELLDDMTAQGKWGYQPGWNAKAVVDPDMAKRFSALPKSGQDVIKAALLFNHEAREQLASATIKAVEAEYNPLIEAADTPEKKTELEAEKRRKLGLYSRVFDTREDVPYSPRARSGDFVAVGMSPEFLEAKTAKDRKTIDKLRQDPAHYWVRFYDSLGEAEATRRRILAEGTYKHVDAFQRDAVGDLDLGGKEMHLAFNQLRTKLAAMLRDQPGDDAAKRLNQLATDLYLHAMSDSSARKAELKSARVAGKDPVTGEALDMFRAFVTRGQATAHFVANLSNTKEVHDAISAMHDEAERFTGLNDNQRADAQRFKNELLWHYVNNLDRKPNKVVERVLRANSIWSLLLKPGYHIQNATQTVGISLPQIAAISSYPRAWREVLRAYGEVTPLVKDWTGDRLDIRKLANPTMRKLAQTLQDRGMLGTGLSMELGSWELNGNGLLPKLWNPVDAAMRQIPQNIEDVNRLTAGIASFRAAKAKGMSDEAATDFATKVIAETHGDYSHFNTPKALKSNELMRIPLQYRKFQMIMAALNAKMFHRAFTSKDMSPEQQWVARRAMAYTMAHQVALAGIKGLPGVGAVGALTMALLGKSMGDWDFEAKKKLDAFFGKDNPMSDLLYKGAPYELLKADMSNTLGMSTVFSPVPFTQLPPSEGKKSDFMATIGEILSGSVGSTAWRFAEGSQFMREGDYYRMLEDWVPTGLAGAMKANRYAKDGLTARNGDTLLKPEELSFMDELLTALSLPSAKISDLQDARGHVFDTEDDFTNQSTLLKRQYLNARKAGDTGKLGEIRQAWAKMNQDRLAVGMKVEPISTLIKAPLEQMKRERQTYHGVQFTPGDRRFVHEVAPD